jgi:hypothetical protein
VQHSRIARSISFSQRQCGAIPKGCEVRVVAWDLNHSVDNAITRTLSGDAVVVEIEKDGMRVRIIRAGLEFYELVDRESIFGSTRVFWYKSSIAVDTAERQSTKRLVESITGFLKVRMLYH